jgi:hypothetical protein
MSRGGQADRYRPRDEHRTVGDLVAEAQGDREVGGEVDNVPRLVRDPASHRAR